jgi:hypothetical protein
MLADIFPTGWHATRLAGLLPDESLVIYGAATSNTQWVGNWRQRRGNPYTGR